jgi:hypothetical protein
VHTYSNVYTLTCIITRVNSLACRKEKNKKIRLYVAEEHFYTTHGYLFKREFAETYSVFCSRCKQEPASPLKQTRRLERSKRVCTQGGVRISQKFHFQWPGRKIIWYTELETGQSTIQWLLLRKQPECEADKSYLSSSDILQDFERVLELSNSNSVQWNLVPLNRICLTNLSI